MSRNYKKVLKMFTTLVLAFVMVMTSVIPAFAAPAVKKAPKLNSEEQTILLGKKFDFNLVDEPKGAAVTWRSSNAKVAAVDASTGVVKGVNKGTATIYCTVIVKDKATYKLTAKVTVIKPAAKIVINNKISQMNVGDEYNLNVTITPKSANDKVTWTTSDKTLAFPTDNGIFKAMKKGTVVITASTLSGRKDSVTIQIHGEGEEIEEETPVTTTPTPAPVVKEEVYKGVVYSEDFTKDTGKFQGRGSAAIEQINKPDAKGKNGYLEVSSRSANWHGASVDVTSLVTKGKTYEVVGWVMYTEGKDTETFKITQQKNGSAWPQITGEVQVNKGEWTKLTGKLTVDADTNQCEVYFEMSSSATLGFLCDDLVIYDPTAK